MFDKGSPEIGEILKKLQQEGFSVRTKDSALASFIIIENLSDTKQTHRIMELSALPEGTFINLIFV